MSKCFADFTERSTYNDRHNSEFNKYSNNVFLHCITIIINAMRITHFKYSLPC